VRAINYDYNGTPYYSDWSQVTFYYAGGQYLTVATDRRNPNAIALTEADLAPIVETAMTRWEMAIGADRAAPLQLVSFEISDLPDSRLGVAYDLLTVVLHEFGHILGFRDLDAAMAPGELMTESIDVGIRRTQFTERFSLPLRPAFRPVGSADEIAPERVDATFANSRGDHLLYDQTAFSPVRQLDRTSVTRDSAPPAEKFLLGGDGRLLVGVEGNMNLRL